MKLFLYELLIGTNGQSPAGVLDFKGVLATVRSAAMAAVSVGVAAALAQFDGHDFGLLDGAVTVAVQALQKLAQQYLRGPQSA